jgi:hypothetical protein
VAVGRHWLRSPATGTGSGSGLAPHQSPILQALSPRPGGWCFLRGYSSTEQKSQTSRCADRPSGGLDLGAGLALSIIEDPVPGLRAVAKAEVGGIVGFRAARAAYPLGIDAMGERCRL